VQYNNIKNTNINVSRVSFGTASLHHLISSKKRRYLLEAIASMGVTHFDTSPYYGYGLSEIDLGVLLRKYRENITVSTKIGLYPPTGATQGVLNVLSRKLLGKFNPNYSKAEVDWSLKRASKSIEVSLKRLNRDYVDFLFLHEPNILLIDKEELMYWAEELKKQGKIRYVGLAGLPKILAPWVESKHPLINILQTRDGANEKSLVDTFQRNGFKPQFTYGYLSDVKKSDLLNGINSIMHDAYTRNSTGSIIVSSKKIERFKELIDEI